MTYTMFSHLWSAAEAAYLFSSLQNEVSFAIYGHVPTVLEYKGTYYSLCVIQFFSDALHSNEQLTGLLRQPITEIGQLRSSSSNIANISRSD